MKIKTITQLIIDAYKKDVEDKLWQQWLVDYNRMGKDSFISWENYKEERMKPPAPKINAEKAIKDAEEIKMLDQKGG